MTIEFIDNGIQFDPTLKEDPEAPKTLDEKIAAVDLVPESRSYSGLTTTGVGVGVSAGRWGISPNINIGVGKSTNNNARDAKLSRLFGERDAVVQSARMKQCAFAAKLKVYGES